MLINKTNTPFGVFLDPPLDTPQSNQDTQKESQGCLHERDSIVYHLHCVICPGEISTHDGYSLARTNHLSSRYGCHQ